MPAMRPPAFRLSLRAIACAAVLGALPGAAGAASCSYAQAASFPLRYTGPGLEVTLDGEINGSPASLLVDTGSFSIFLTQTGVERHKLPLRYTMGYVTGVGGNAKIAHSRVRDMAAGPVHSGKAEMDVITKTGYVPSYDAIIGAPFLLQVDTELSLSDKVLKMYTGSGCGDTFLAIWDEDAIDVPFVRGYEKGKIPHFKVKVNGHELNAMIDSGAGRSTIELEAARRAGVTLEGPGVTPLADTAGVGERKVHQWSARLESLSIGTETISKPVLTIMDTDGRTNEDVILGTDFLRAHRVLFAMSQGKLYLAYLGGDVFPEHKRLEPWIQREADAGNPDAQYLVAQGYLRGPDRAQGMDRLRKAADNGSPYANLMLGTILLNEGHYQEAELRTKAGLDKLPSERMAALNLFLARQHTGNAQAAARELEASFESADGEWPAPIADFYLGRIGVDELLAKARDKEYLARTRTCQAKNFIVQWYTTHGDSPKAAAMAQSARAECGTPTALPGK